MELEKFIEQDIVEFLDMKSDAMRETLTQMRSEEVALFSVERDYAAETHAALASNNIERAKNIFDQLRDNFNHMNKGTPEREKVYAIVQEVYAMIKEHFDRTKGSTLQDEITDIEKHGFNDAPEPQGDASATPQKSSSQPAAAQNTTLASQTPTPIVPKTPFEVAALKAREERDLLEDEIYRLIGSIRIQLASGAVAQAISSYKEVKELFDKYPSTNRAKKTELFNMVMAMYNDILFEHEQTRATTTPQGSLSTQKAQATTSTQQGAWQTSTSVQNSTSSPTSETSRSEVLAVIKTCIKSSLDALDVKDVHRAESFLIDANHRVSKLDDSYASERQGLTSIISKITSRIQFMKSQPSEVFGAKR